MASPVRYKPSLPGGQRLRKWGAGFGQPGRKSNLKYYQGGKDGAPPARRDSGSPCCSLPCGRGCSEHRTSRLKVMSPSKLRELMAWGGAEWKMEFPADGKYQFLSVFLFTFVFLFFSSWGQEVKPSYPFAKWKDCSSLKAELISERLKCFTSAFLIAVKRSDVSPQEGFSLGFFPDGVGWNFPSNSTGKKINFEKKARLAPGAASGRGWRPTPLGRSWRRSCPRESRKVPEPHGDPSAWGKLW